MKTKRFLALTMALSMTAGAMTVLPVAYAEGNSTDFEFTMTVPAKTTMNSDGTAVALTNGLKVEGSNMTKDVVVTMAGADDWKMIAEGKSTTIGYNVYDTPACTDAVTSVEFDKTAVGSDAGSTKELYVKPNAEDLAAAEAGTYTGSITFTAGLQKTINDIMNPGTEWTVSFVTDGGTYDVSFKTKENKTIETTKVLKNNKESTEVDVEPYADAFENGWFINFTISELVEEDDGTVSLKTVNVDIDTMAGVRCIGDGHPRVSGFIVDGTDITSQINRQ